jgi:DNA-binding response OmpR family regulator
MSHHREILFSGMTVPNGGSATQRTPERKQVHPSPPRVLLVSEDEQSASSLAFHLSKNGLDPLVALDGAAALQLAGAREFDMLVTDVEMSPLDGVRVATAFRNINPASQVFLVTSAYEIARKLLIDANLAWDFGILLKPIDPEQLAQVLRSAWSRGACL